MSVIFLNPLRSTVTIDGALASGVDFTGIDPTIVAVSWYETAGSVTYYSDPNLTVHPAPTPISSLVPYQTYIDEATDILYAAANPKTYYFTEQTTYNGTTYFIGSSYISTSVGWPAPPNTTLEVPPTVPAGQNLYWFDSKFVCSYYDPSQPLAEEKSASTDWVNSTAYSILQPTDWYVIRESENGTAIPPNWNAWREAIRQDANTKNAGIAGCNSSEELFSYTQNSSFNTWTSAPK